MFCLVLAAAAVADAGIRTVRNTAADGDGSLREAIDDAEKGDTVVFASGVRGTIALEAPLEVTVDLTIRGPGADVVTVRGVGENTLRLAGAVSVSGLTLSGGETVLVVERGKATLLDSAVRDGAGTGIRADRGRLMVRRTMVAGNAGPGIVSDGAEVTCVNSTVAENGGAGIRVDDGTLRAANCTITHNRGAGVQADGGEATLGHTVLAGNQRACNGRVTSDGHNLVDDTSCGFAGLGDVQTDDARVQGLAANGGATETVALSGGSPAVDGGDSAGCPDPAGGVLTVDQRGQRRPAGGRCDIGAFEQPLAVSGTVVNRIVALVDGDPITTLELRKFAASDPRLQQAAATDEAGLLEVLITQRVLAKEIQAQGIVVPDAEIDRSIASIRQRNKISDDQLDAALAQQGMTRERYRQQVREELERAQLINREIRGKVTVSPEEIDRYQRTQGNEKPADAGASEGASADAEPTPQRRGGEMTVSHIVLQIPPGASAEEIAAVEARAAAIHAQLEDGADFAEVAKRESEDGAAKAGGKLGTFKPGEMRDELDSAVADLDPGEYSDPVRSATGIHIVRLDARAGAGESVAEAEAAAEAAAAGEAPAAPATDAAREAIKEQLYAQALEERYTRWIKEDLRQRHMVEIVP
jgi:peptidyl-prolyl cis-trans isomerase SurA